MALASKGEIIDEQKVRYLITLVQSGNDDQVAQMARDVVCITAKGKPIKAKTIGQQKYMRPSRRTPSPWVWVLPVPAKPTWLWPPP